MQRYRPLPKISNVQGQTISRSRNVQGQTLHNQECTVGVYRDKSRKTKNRECTGTDIKPKHECTRIDITGDQECTGDTQFPKSRNVKGQAQAQM